VKCFSYIYEVEEEEEETNNRKTWTKKKILEEKRRSNKIWKKKKLTHLVVGINHVSFFLFSQRRGGG
jgi:hypothetical protein